MRITINFKYQLFLKKNKINNIISNGFLPAEFYSITMFIS